MTALVAATNRIKGGVWFMFGLVTLIQMIGNIFFSFKEIDVNGDLFKSWVELKSPVWEMLGSDPGDVISQKRWLAFLEGGLLPIISLTSLHFFTKYERNRTDDKVEIKETPSITQPDEDISDEEYEQVVQDFVRKQKEQEDKLKYTPTEEDFKKLEEFLRNLNYDGPTKEIVDTDSVKFTPNEEELKKIEEVLYNFSKPNTVEIEEEKIEEVPLNEEMEFITEEKDNENIVENETVTEETVEQTEDENSTLSQNKVLNYYKNR
jgi:hypothetical protein